jgi:hypothetical protein
MASFRRWKLLPQALIYLRFVRYRKSQALTECVHLRFFQIISLLWMRLTRKGFTQYGYLKNFGSTQILLPIKNNKLKTFSKAHIAES